MSRPDDPMVPIKMKIRSSTLGLVDALAERLRIDREICAIGARVDREAVLRLAIERGVASLERGLSLRMLRRDHADLFDPMTLYDD